MQGIRMFAEMAAEADLSPDDRRDFSETICREIDRLVGMCQEILDFARGTTNLARAPVVLDDFVMETVLSLAAELEQHHVELDVRLDHGGTLCLDANRMRRVVLNLCCNAIEAMGSDGGTLRLATAAAAGGARIEVTDTGPGIPPEIVDSIFEPFVTHGKDHGTGLGLAIVKKVVEDHGGTIDVVTQQGEGSTFSICLPSAAQGGDHEQPGHGHEAAGPGAELGAEAHSAVV
jgi:signal transduction histidine kinase